MDTFGQEFQSLVKVPSVRYFNALLRIGGFKDREFEVMVSCLSSFGTASILCDYLGTAFSFRPKCENLA